MQPPLDYPHPQIYWVGRGAASPWAPPRSVFPDPSSVPERPGQRPPPPPRPPQLPPLPPPPPLPPKKRRDHNTDLWLLVIFLMVLVALVGLGLSMYQLFHLQKELTELRESTNQSHTLQSSEKQIGHLDSHSEKKEVKNVAHLTGKPNSKSLPLEWEDTYGMALLSGVKYEKGGLVINDTGLYFVYSKVYFRGQSCKNQPLVHRVFMRTSKYPADILLMEEMMINYCTTGRMWGHSSYLGAIFNLSTADHLYVNVSQLTLVNFEESKTFFGLYKL